MCFFLFFPFKKDIQTGYLAQSQTVNQRKNPDSNPSLILAKSLHSVLPDLPLKALRRLGGGSQEQDMVRLELGPDLNSDSLSDGRKCSAVTFTGWKSRGRGPGRAEASETQKGRSSFSVQFFWGTAQA